MHTKIDITKWDRHSIYEFFIDYDDPFFNVCCTVDVTCIYEYAKRKDFSFHLCLLYYALKSANQLKEFKTRIVNGEVIVFDKVNCGSTILHDDETFSFCPFEYKDDLHSFIENGMKNIATFRQMSGIKPRPDLYNVIHFSVIPWINFTSIKHAKKLNNLDSIPKITFGKFKKANSSFEIPISIEVNHALMDGLHVYKYLDLLQKNINAYHI